MSIENITPEMKSQSETMIAKTEHSESRPQSRGSAGGGAKAPADHPSAHTARTSGPEGRSCRLCGPPIPGKRRYWCSDRCRMKAG